MDTSTYMLERARSLRHELTRAERRLLNCLRNRRMEDCKFRRQHPIGPYVLDFYCEELRLAIELDGRHHQDHQMLEYDDRRSRDLANRGIEVIRIANDELSRDAEMIERWLREEVRRRRGAPSPGASRHPLPEGEG